MKLAAGLVTLALSFGSVLAVVPIYGQCGGIGYVGDTTCVSGSTCIMIGTSPYFYHCVADSTTSVPVTTTKPPSTTSGPTSTAAPPASTGFVKTSGQSFTLDGARYTVVGGNAYWVGLTGLSTTNMNAAFSDIAKAGGTTVRTWGFNEVLLQSVLSGPSRLIYYQSWSGSTPTVNTGSNGLGNFDNVVAAAKAHGIRLIVALTKNWSDYGGMDVYVKQILKSPNHDLFYTNPNVIAAYKNYIKVFVGRYVNEPTILGWELANEPRCKGSTGVSSGTCTTTTITNWAKEISAYIKSIDSNHIVGLGDEGFYNRPGAATYPYQGSEGIDFDANLAISTIDFGTFHSYPTSWGQGGNEQSWGTQWITDHHTSQAKAGKPVILEEFGVTSNQTTIYTAWWNQVVSSGLTGDIIWQSGSHLSSGDTPNDGYTIYPDSAVYPILTSHAAKLKARA